MDINDDRDERRLSWRTMIIDDYRTGEADATINGESLLD
jgi:hypothetical protein